MKLVLYNNFQLGVLQGDAVVDAGDSVADLGHHNAQEMMQMIIRDWDTMQSKIEGAIIGGNRTALDSVTLQPPLPRPGQLMCAAVNYLEPRQPDRGPFNGFLKANTSVIPTGGKVELPAAEATVFHFEPELALVIGRRASRLSQAEALDYVFGYTQFMDVSARGLPGGFFLGKSWHTFAPMGPALVTADEVSTPNDLSVKLWVNDTLKHDFSTGEMARHIPELLEEITKVITLEPGDVVATGTHHEALSPIEDGFKVRLGIEGFGPPLEVSVHDSLKRRW
ncbi:MAG: fumarylacetoacetate hydrolase family protein [bacterium]|nr:fumarylacetoacetate hydrolase family protein [bacterium]